jgi:hypothetical protein
MYVSLILLGLTHLKIETLIPPDPLKKGGILEAPFLRGLGDLFCVSPAYD